MECTKILQRIYTFVTSRSIDLTDELKSFDYKQTGSISEVSFPRCVNQFGLQLSPSQFKILIREFSRDGCINIQDFVAAVKNSNSIISLEETTKNLTCNSELNQLKELLIKRRQTLYDIFRKYDRFNNGKVPSSCYYTEFGFGPTVKKIVSSYEIDGKIDYNQMQKDLQLPNINGDDSNDLPYGFDTLVNFINKRGINIRQLLSRFANTENGESSELSPRLFISFISSIGITFDPAALEEIISVFRLSNGNYDAEKFCFLVEKTGFQTALQESLKNKTININQQRLNTIDPLKAFDNIKYYFKSHRINVRDVFSIFDDEGLNGIVEECRFVRLFQNYQFGIDKLEVIQAASLFPGDRVETVDYHQFVESVEDKPYIAPVTIDSIIQKLKKNLSENHKRIRPIAFRYDKEQSGDITMSQFISVLQQCQAPLMNMELVMLRDRFPGNSDKTIDYISISNIVDPIEPNYSQSITNQKTEKLENSAKLPASRQLPDNVSNANRKVAFLCARKNIDLSSYLVKLDSEFSGTLHQMKFLNFMMNPPLSLEPSVIRVILNFYRLNGSIEIDYVSFCRDLASIDLSTANTQNVPTSPDEKPVNTNEMSNLRPPIAIPMIVHLLLKKFKLFVSQNGRLSLFSPFVALDAGRTGFVPASRVQTCFNKVGFETSRDEIEATINTFRDGRRYENFNYYMFVKAAEAEDNASSVSELTPEVQKEVLGAQIMIKDRLSSRNRSIYLAFNGVNKRSISIQAFFERLAAVDIALRSAQANALVKKYRIDQTDQIDWRRFCEDVQKVNTVQF